MATHSSPLVWRIPGTGEPGGLPSMGSHRVWHDWSDLAAAAACLESLYVPLCSFFLAYNMLNSYGIFDFKSVSSNTPALSYLFLNWRVIALQNCIGFSKYQHESAIGIPTFFWFRITWFIFQFFHLNIYLSIHLLYFYFNYLFNILPSSLWFLIPISY